MESQVSELSPVLVELSVQVPWTRVNDGLEAAFKQVQRRAKVRGFRPGKVPRHIVKQMMGKDVRDEVVANLVQEGVSAAIKQHSLEAVAMTHVDPAVITDGEPLAFKAKLEVRPKIANLDVSIEVQRVIPTVADAEIDAELERLRQNAAELVTPEPMRPSKADDVLTIDYHVSVDGNERDGMKAEARKISLGGKGLLPELETGLTGKSPGDVADIEVTFPEDITSDDLKGKKAVFHVVIKEVQERVLPSIDDDFAKDLEHESLEAMKKSIQERLLETAKARSEANLHDALVEALIDKNPIPVPPSMTVREQQHMLQELLQYQRILGQSIPFGDDMKADLEKRAERKVRAALLLGEIAKNEKLEITNADLDERFKVLAESTGKHIAKVRAEHQGEKRQELEQEILQGKLLEYLRSKATIRDAAPTPVAQEPNK